MARRAFVNTEIPLPDGTVAVFGVHQGPNGELAVKLRLPSDYWSLDWLARAKPPGYSSGKTVVVLDRRDP